MDLKTSYVSVQTDFGSMNGRVLDLVMFLRKQHLVIYHE